MPADPLAALDETAELDVELTPPLGDAGALALDLRESATRVKRLGAMNALQQMQHAPDVLADALGQVAYALELIELRGRG